MPVWSTRARCRSSNGGSFTNTLAGTSGSPRSATRARPVVPELRSRTVASVTSRPSTRENHGASRSSTSTGRLVGELTTAPPPLVRGAAAEPSRHDSERYVAGIVTARPSRVPRGGSTMVMATDDHYTIISADCHAGANHETYRSYLEARYLDDFDAWRAKYKNPFRDLQDGGRVRNWDDERRLGDLHADGQVAEVVFPN